MAQLVASRKPIFFISLTRSFSFFVGIPTTTEVRREGERSEIE